LNPPLSIADIFPYPMYQSHLDKWKFFLISSFSFVLVILKLFYFPQFSDPPLPLTSLTGLVIHLFARVFQVVRFARFARLVLLAQLAQLVRFFLSLKGHYFIILYPLTTCFLQLVFPRHLSFPLRLIVLPSYFIIASLLWPPLPSFRFFQGPKPLDLFSPVLMIVDPQLTSLTIIPILIYHHFMPLLDFPVYQLLILIFTLPPVFFTLQFLLILPVAPNYFVFPHFKLNLINHVLNLQTTPIIMVNHLLNLLFHLFFVMIN
jgi:hypothetical protein